MLAAEIRRNLTLAAPLIAVYAGQQTMGLVDAAMVGRLGNAQLAGTGIGNGLFWAVSTLGMGFMLGLDPLVSQAVGAGERDRAELLLRRGMWLGFWVSLPLMALLAVMPLVLGPAGVEPETAREATRFVLARVPSMLPVLLSIALRSYLQAVGTVRPILLSVLLANLLNVPANLVLIFGDAALYWVGLPPLGLPALGVVGSALSTTLATTIAFGALWQFRPRAAPRPAGSSKSTTPSGVEMTWAMVRLGIPIGLQFLAEVGVFAIASVLAGRLGKAAGAAHTVALTVASFTFSVALAIGATTAVRVGTAVGRSDAKLARIAGLAGLLVIAVYEAGSALTMLLAPAWVASRVSSDPIAIVAAVPLLMIAALFQLSDGVQAVAGGALRGAGDTRPSLYANLIGHYAIGLPLAVWLAFGLKLGAAGLWWGLSAGLTAVAIPLLLRFWQISGRPMERVETR